MIIFTFRDIIAAVILSISLICFGYAIIADKIDRWKRNKKKMTGMIFRRKIEI